MFKMKIVFFLFLFFTLSTSCFHRDSTNITSIEVSFIKGNVEKPIPISCGALAFMRGGIVKDTVLSGVKELSEIELQLSSMKEKNMDSTVHSCDVRIHCLVHFKNNKTIKLCIGQFNCIVEDNIRMINNDTLIYLIRKGTGYYNYFSKDDLAYFDELKQFGIPNDYKDLSSTKNLGLPHPPPPPQ